jgi:hypothetical protein
MRLLSSPLPQHRGRDKVTVTHKLFIYYVLTLRDWSEPKSTITAIIYISLLYQPWMIYDCGGISGMNEWQGKPKYSEKMCRSVAVRHKSHMIWSGLEPGPPRWEGGDWQPELQHDLRITLHTIGGRYVSSRNVVLLEHCWTCSTLHGAAIIVTCHLKSSQHSNHRRQLLALVRYHIHYRQRPAQTPKQVDIPDIIILYINLWFITNKCSIFSNTLPQ